MHLAQCLFEEFVVLAVVQHHVAVVVAPEDLFVEFHLGCQAAWLACGLAQVGVGRLRKAVFVVVINVFVDDVFGGFGLLAFSH